MHSNPLSLFCVINMDFVSIQIGTCLQSVLQQIMICILARVMTNHNFVPRCWLIITQVNL